MSTFNRGIISDFEYDSGQDSASLLSCTLAFLVPLILGCYWLLYAFSEDLAVPILRPAVLLSAFLLVLLWSKLPLTWAELRLGKIMLVMCVVLIAPSLTATIPSRALADCVKLSALCLIALLVCRALRHEGTARAFGRGLVLASLLAAGLTIYTYVSLVGLTLPTYESTRVLKAVAMHANIPLNAVAFASVFAYICGMCLLRGTTLLWSLGFVLFPISSILTGSRAPIAVLLASVLILMLFNGVVSSRLTARVLTWLAIAGLAIAIAWGSQRVTYKGMSLASEGRWDLWWVGLQKFAERPLLGYGFDSWRDDLVSRLPGDYGMTSFIARNIAGGYHNEYVTMLAEQGLIGFFPIMALFVFLLRCSWKLAFQRSATWKNGQWALFGCLFLMLRAAIEAPGLFGYGQEPADYLAFLFVAIVVSRFSVEEDYLKYAQALSHSRQYAPQWSSQPRAAALGMARAGSPAGGG
jgi:O-antigen ligase